MPPNALLLKPTLKAEGRTEVVLVVVGLRRHRGWGSPLTRANL